MVSAFPQGIHVSFLLILIGAILVTALAGAIIGLPTLRLRGDYIAIVTLAFGEIIGRFAANGDTVIIKGYALSNGRESISPIDQLNSAHRRRVRLRHQPPIVFWPARSLCRSWVLFVNFRLRDSRLGRAWIALREDLWCGSQRSAPTRGNITRQPQKFRPKTAGVLCR